MTVPSDMAERHGRALARYAELCLSLAEDMHAAATAASEPEQKARLAEGFHRVGRAMRQSMALEARFVRERARDLKADEADAAEVKATAVRRRREQVRGEVERAIYSELEGCEADTWLADFDERLEAETLEDRFLDEDVDAQVARLAASLGLTGEKTHNYVPRRLRRPGLSQADLERAFREMMEAEEDDDEEDDEGDDGGDDDGGDDDGGGDDPEPPADPPPAPPDDVPPEPKAEAEPEPLPEPPPDPPPGPPDPEPYVPPWERDPHARFPGGSGY